MNYNENLNQLSHKNEKTQLNVINALKNYLSHLDKEPELAKLTKNRIVVLENQLDEYRKSHASEIRLAAEEFVKEFNIKNDAELEVMSASAKFLQIGYRGGNYFDTYVLELPTVKEFKNDIRKAEELLEYYAENKEKWEEIIDSSVGSAVFEDMHSDVFRLMSELSHNEDEYLDLSFDDKVTVKIKYDTKFLAEVKIDFLDAERVITIEENVIDEVLEIARSRMVKVRF